MELPEINLVFLDNILTLPIHIHPLFVHFAIAIPIIILLIELFNLVIKRKVIDVVNIGLLGILIFILFGAYISGVTDGKEAFDFLDTQGQAALKSHKILGTYIIVFGFGLVALFKVIALFSDGMKFKAMYLVMLLLFIGVTLKQGKDGGELVNLHGANVQKVKVLDAKLLALQNMHNDLNSSYNELNASIIKLNEQYEKTIAELNASLQVMPIDTNMTIAPIPAE